MRSPASEASREQWSRVARAQAGGVTLAAYHAAARGRGLIPVVVERDDDGNRKHAKPDRKPAYGNRYSLAYLEDWLASPDHLIGIEPVTFGLVVLDVDVGDVLDAVRFAAAYPPAALTRGNSKGAHIYYSTLGRRYKNGKFRFARWRIAGDVKSWHSFILPADWSALPALDAPPRPYPLDEEPLPLAAPLLHSATGGEQLPLADGVRGLIDWPRRRPRAVAGERHTTLLECLTMAARWPRNYGRTLADWRQFAYWMNEAFSPPFSTSGEEGAELRRLASWTLEFSRKAERDHDPVVFAKSQGMKRRGKPGPVHVEREARNAEIARLAQIGVVDVARISALTGLAGSSVREILRSRGATTGGHVGRTERLHQRSRERDARLVAGRAAGRTLRALAADEEMTAEGVRLALKRLGA